MNKKLISLLTVLSIVMSMLGTFTVFADETEDITEISTLAEFEAFRDSVNNGNTYEGKTVTLTADIDMSEKYGEGKESWTSIGIENWDTDTHKPFSGTFEGNGHKITNLYINDTGNGLFSLVSGTVKELGVEGYIYATFDTAEVIGGITADLYGTIERCFFSGSIEGERHIGGIAGSNVGQIIDCYNKGTITAWEHCGGGIAGTGGERNSLTRCYNVGTITKPTSEHASPYYGSITGGGFDTLTTDCYYLEGTHANGAYLNEGTDPTIALTAEQFADKASFANWDFDTVWEMDENLGRPVLQSNRETTKHTHKVCSDENCTDNHEDIEWTAWDSDTSLPDSAGNYYLATDVTLTAAWNVPDETALCLNGHVIALDSSIGTETTVDIYTNTVTVLTDCSDTEHKFSVDDEQWVRDEENGAETLTGGVIISPNEFGVVVNSPFDMYNINIAASKYGILNADTLSLYGCTIKGNSDGITNYGELNMRDCSILENAGDGIYFGSGSVSIGGKIIITNNVTGSKNTNLRLNRKAITISEPLEEGSVIGVSAKKRPLTDSPTAVTGACDADYSGYFVSDNADDFVTYSVKNGDDNVIYLEPNAPTEFRIMDDYTGTILAAAPKAGTYVAILAVYSNDGVLRHITTTPVTFDEPSVKSIFEDRYSPDFSNKTTLMLWYNLESMQPCCESKTRLSYVGAR